MPDTPADMEEASVLAVTEPISATTEEIINNEEKSKQSPNKIAPSKSLEKKSQSPKKISESHKKETDSPNKKIKSPEEIYVSLKEKPEPPKKVHETPKKNRSPSKSQIPRRTGKESKLSQLNKASLVCYDSADESDVPLAPTYEQASTSKPLQSSSRSRSTPMSQPSNTINQASTSSTLTTPTNHKRILSSDDNSPPSAMTKFRKKREKKAQKYEPIPVIGTHHSAPPRMSYADVSRGGSSSTSQESRGKS